MMGADDGTFVREAANHSPQRQDNIDLLRAMAILAVVAYHYSAAFPQAYYLTETIPFSFPLGWLGVDMFFAVSAFCIFMTLESAGRLERFWAKRFARIQPAYMFAVCLTFAMVAWFGLPGRETSFGIALANIFWGTMIPGVPRVDGVYWSLIVELKFYFLIGPIFFLLKGRNISLAWAGICLLGWLITISQQVIDPDGEYLIKAVNGFLISQYAPQFLVGLLAFEWRRLSIRSIVAITLVIILTVIGSKRFYGYEVAGLIVLAVTFGVLQLRQLPVFKPVVFIGLISYPLYLVHQNIGLIIIRELADVMPDFIWRQLIAFALVLAISVIMHYGIETRWQRSLARSIEAVLAGVFRLSRTLRRKQAAEPD